jgi:hypothetical protein
MLHPGLAGIVEKKKGRKQVSESEANKQRKKSNKGDSPC